MNHAMRDAVVVELGQPLVLQDLPIPVPGPGGYKAAGTVPPTGPLLETCMVKRMTRIADTCK